jgi:hypothetical protein
MDVEEDVVADDVDVVDASAAGRLSSGPPAVPTWTRPKMSPPATSVPTTTAQILIAEGDIEPQIVRDDRAYPVSCRGRSPLDVYRI